jgi:hypothetical protein
MWWRLVVHGGASAPVVSAEDKDDYVDGDDTISARMELERQI